jgi:hypothetical protein
VLVRPARRLVRYEFGVTAPFARCLLFGAGLLVACASAPPAPRFAPAAAEFQSGLPVITFPALRAHARDVRALQGAGAIVLGELAVDDGRAAAEAARHGATHYVWVGDGVEERSMPSLCWSRAALLTAPVATSCRPGRELVVAPHFVLVRVEQSAWSTLPAELRPSVWLTPLPSQCRCSANVGGREIWCDGSLWRASPLELEIYCAGS